MIFRDAWKEFKNSLGWREMETEMQEAIGLAVSKLVQGEVHNLEQDAYLRGLIYGLSSLHDFEPEFIEETQDEHEVSSTGVSDSSPIARQDGRSEGVKRPQGTRLHG